MLAATAEGLVRLFARADGASGGGRGDGDGGASRADERSLFVSKQTWAACVAEAGRRRVRVARMLGGDPTCRVEAAGKGGGYEGAAASGGSGGRRIEATGKGAEEEEGDDEM